MLSNAISKLKDEIEKNKNNPYIQVVGEFLLQHLEKNSQDAEKIMVEGKTIEKSLDEMRKVAQKKKVGNCAVLTDQEGFAVVLKYFGVEQIINSQAPVASPRVKAPEVTPKPMVDFNIKLEDFL